MATKPTSIASASLEGAALELLMQIQKLESQSANNPNTRNFVTGTYNSDTNTYAGTFSFPCNLDIGTAGQIEIEVQPYLVD